MISAGRSRMEAGPGEFDSSCLATMLMEGSIYYRSWLPLVVHGPVDHFVSINLLQYLFYYWCRSEEKRQVTRCRTGLKSSESILNLTQKSVFLSKDFSVAPCQNIVVSFKFNKGTNSKEE